MKNMSQDLQNICSRTKKKHESKFWNLCRKTNSSRVEKKYSSRERENEDLERQLSSASYDSSEFLFRRRHEYKRAIDIKEFILAVLKNSSVLKS